MKCNQLKGKCDGKWMDPLVTMQSAFIVITMTAGGVASPLSLGEDVVFTRPSLQCVDRI